MNSRVRRDLRGSAGADGSDGPTKVESNSALRDPSAQLTVAFRAVAARMEGLSFVNPALEVEAVGFAPWEGRWLGVMLTPWFMNLTLVPADPAAWQPLARGAKRRYRFPAGEYEFIGAHDAAIGEYQVCSLFSPMQQFADHGMARLVAQFAREALFDPANAETPQPPTANLAPAAADAGPGPLARLETGLVAPLSKRELLRGQFAGGGRGDRG